MNRQNRSSAIRTDISTGHNDVDASLTDVRNDAAGQLHDNAAQEDVYAVSDESTQRTPSAPGFEAVKAAAARIANYAHRTPVMTSRSLNALVGAQLFFKCENLQRAGAFKFRGATNDDARIIAGQATAALELLEDVNDLDAIIAPVGGGGLLAGTVISAAAIQTGSATHAAVYGAEPATADDTYRSFRARKRLLLSATPDTIADGLRTNVGVMNFPIIRDGAADILTASEAQIARAMRLLLERMKLVVEPSAALPLACLLQQPQHLAGKRIGLILSGGNVDLENLPW